MKGVRALLIAAGLLLLLANGACALMGVAQWQEPRNSYAGIGFGLAGMLLFYAAVPAGLAALVVVAMRRDTSARPRTLALLGAALGGVALFWALALTPFASVGAPVMSYIVLFGAGAAAAGALLAAQLRPR